MLFKLSKFHVIMLLLLMNFIIYFSEIFLISLVFIITIIGLTIELEHQWNAYQISSHETIISKEKKLN